MPPCLKYATDFTPGKKVGLHYTASVNANYAPRPRKRDSSREFAPKIVCIFIKLRNQGYECVARSAG